MQYLKLKHVRKWDQDMVVSKLMNYFKPTKKQEDITEKYFNKIWEKIENFMKLARIDEVMICDDCNVRIPCYPENQMPQRYYYCDANHCYKFDGVGPRILCMFCGNIDALNADKPSYAFDFISVI